MPARIVIRNSIYASSTNWPRKHDSTPRNRAGEIIEDPLIRPDSPDKPFRAGEPYYDKADDLIYRIVRVGALGPLEGWRSASFWMERWELLMWADLKVLIEKGWLDAAIEEGSAARKFRCRDEQRVLAWIKDAKAQKRDRSRRANLPRRTRRT